MDFISTARFTRGLAGATSLAVVITCGSPTSPGSSESRTISLEPSLALAAGGIASVTVTMVPSIPVGGTTLATAIARTTSGRIRHNRKPKWSSDNISIAIVDSISGIVRGVAIGTTLITATVDGVIGQAPINVVPGAPPVATQLAIVTQPSTSVTNGAVFPSQPAVALRDAVGNAVGQAGITVTAVIASGGGTLSGTVTALSDANGVATFTNLAITGSVGTRTLSFGAVGLIGATSIGIAITPGAVSVAMSTVSVSSSTLAAGATATLTLQAKDASNNNLTTGGLTVAFTATGGTSTGSIGSTTDNSNGTYTATFTAGTAGTARTIGATINGSAVTSTPPTITVTPGAVSVATSTLAVSSSTVASGATATLTLQAKDANNNNLTTGGLTVVFTATGGTSIGTIGATTDHANGIYTATFIGQAAGTAKTIGATIDGAAVTSTLPTITVTTTTSSPNPNEPAGMTLYSDRDFNNTTLVNGWLDVSQVYNGAIGWRGGTYSISNGNYAIVTDPSAPVSPPNVAQITYRVGLLSGYNPLGPNSIQQLTVPSNAVKTIYTRQRIKLSSNWLPPGNSNVAKLGFIKRQDDRPITYIALQGSASPFRLSVRGQNYSSANPPPTGWQRNLGSPGDDNFAVNVWNDLEIVLVMNSAPGVHDGSVDVWLNGKHIISTSAPPYNGTTYARPNFWDSAANPGFWKGPSLEPTWGGADGWPNPTEKKAWWDRFYVSGKP